MPVSTLLEMPASFHISFNPLFTIIPPFDALTQLTSLCYKTINQLAGKILGMMTCIY